MKRNKLSLSRAAAVALAALLAFGTAKAASATRPFAQDENTNGSSSGSPTGTSTGSASGEAGYEHMIKVVGTFGQADAATGLPEGWSLSFKNTDGTRLDDPQLASTVGYGDATPAATPYLEGKTLRPSAKARMVLSRTIKLADYGITSDVMQHYGASLSCDAVAHRLVGDTDGCERLVANVILFNPDSKSGTVFAKDTKVYLANGVSWSGHLSPVVSKMDSRATHVRFEIEVVPGTDAASYEDATMEVGNVVCRLISEDENNYVNLQISSDEYGIFFGDGADPDNGARYLALSDGSSKARLYCRYNASSLQEEATVPEGLKMMWKDNNGKIDSDGLLNVVSVMPVPTSGTGEGDEGDDDDDDDDDDGDDTPKLEYKFLTYTTPTVSPSSPYTLYGTKDECRKFDMWNIENGTPAARDAANPQLGLVFRCSDAGTTTVTSVPMTLGLTADQLSGGNATVWLGYDHAGSPSASCSATIELLDASGAVCQTISGDAAAATASTTSAAATAEPTAAASYGHATLSSPITLGGGTPTQLRVVLKGKGDGTVLSGPLMGNLTLGVNTGAAPEVRQVELTAEGNGHTVPGGTFSYFEGESVFACAKAAEPNGLFSQWADGDGKRFSADTLVCAKVEAVDDNITLKAVFQNLEATHYKSSSKWATFYYRKEVTLPLGVTAHTVSGLSAEDPTKLVLSTPMTTVPAYTPVLIHNPGEKLLDFTLYNCASPVDEGTYASSVTSSCLKATLAGRAAANGTYVLQRQDGVIAFYRVDTSVAKPSVTPFHCWIELPSQSAAARLLLPDSTPTAIGGITVDDPSAQPSDTSASTAPQPVYNLQGQRVMVPVKGQVYIVKGKKVKR